MAKKLVIIIVLLAGCGDASPPFAPGTITEPEPEPEPEPAVFELPCNRMLTQSGHLYVYAEAEAPPWDMHVFTCANPATPFGPAICEPATDYIIDEGVVRVLCGEWTAGAETADFVRIEEVRM